MKFPVIKTDVKAPPELIPFIGKTTVRMNSEQRTNLPEFFEYIPDLQELDVSINKLEIVPESLWRCTQLTKLDISFNPLKIVPDGIARLTALRKLVMRGCPIEGIPEALALLKNLTILILTECPQLHVDKALQVIAQLPKLKTLSLPLSTTLTSLAPIAPLPLKELTLSGASVQHPVRLPSGLSQLKKLSDLRIEYANDIALLPEAPEDVNALRLLFSKQFTDDDIRQSAQRQPEKLYLRAFADSL